MKSGNWDQIGEWFDAALEQPATRRDSWLREACTNVAVREEVLGLLHAHDRSNGILEHPISTATVEEQETEFEDEQWVGPYQLLRQIGRGGMGMVYQAHDSRLNRYVAIKFLSPALRASSEAKARFLSEARASSGLDHPNICTIYDLGEHQNQLFIVMAFYDGETLAQRLRRGPLPLSSAVTVMRQVASGLACAHDAGIVHRDIKPSNLFMTVRGEVKILDFGVAKLESDTVTNLPGRVGTLAYMSPEQALAIETDARTDLWSAGVVLHEMLTGVRPFEHPRPGGLRGLLSRETAPAKPQASVPLVIEPLLNRLLSHDREERTPSAATLLDELDRLTLPSSDAGTTQLPRPLTSFIGRERELSQISELLGRVRLVTLTGPAGTGKTRLALEVAHSLESSLPDGAAFIPLGAITDASLFSSAIAQALALPETPGAPMSGQLRKALHGRRMLLVLDNFEQIASAAVEVASLLAACPGLRVLATSRVRLHVNGEHEFPVPTLAHSANVRISECPAVRLFAERARAVQPDFALTPDNTRAVAELCAGLDGLPLAIELAAARIKVLTVPAMLSRLGSRLDLLKGGHRDRPARHQTLRGAIAWSVDLLPEEGRKCFRRLPVFTGGCTLEAAESVCSGLGDLQHDALDLLDMLVDQSLIRRDDSCAAEPRFLMLATIRAYAIETLEEAGETAALREVHARYFLDLAERAAPELTGAGQTGWWDKLAREHENFRAALDWAEARARATSDASDAMRLGVALWRFWLVRGHVEEGAKRLERLLQLPGARTNLTLRAALLNGLATLAQTQGRLPFARDLLKECLDLYRGANDEPGIAQALNNLSWIHLELCEFETARGLSVEALDLCRRLGETRGAALAYNNLGWIANYQGDYYAASDLHTRSLGLRREIGDQRGVAFALSSLAWAEQTHGNYPRAAALLAENRIALEGTGDRVLNGFMLQVAAGLALDRGEPDALRLALQGIDEAVGGGNQSLIAMGHMRAGAILCERGDLDEARRYLEMSLASWLSRDSTWGEGMALYWMGCVAQASGRPEIARGYYEESLERHHRLGDQRDICSCLESLASLDLDAAAAVRRLAKAAAIRQRLGCPIPFRSRASHQALIERLREKLGSDTFHSIWSEGQEGKEQAAHSGTP